MRRSETLFALLGFAVLVPLFFLQRLLTPPGLFFGALQEQYYLLGQYAYEHQTLRSLAAGFFPLWNPDNALGHPFLGDMLSGILFPLRLLIYLVPHRRHALLLPAACRKFPEGAENRIVPPTSAHRRSG